MGGSQSTVGEEGQNGGTFLDDFTQVLIDTFEHEIESDPSKDEQANDEAYDFVSCVSEFFMARAEARTADMLNWALRIQKASMLMDEELEKNPTAESREEFSSRRDMASDCKRRALEQAQHDLREMAGQRSKQEFIRGIEVLCEELAKAGANGEGSQSVPFLATSAEQVLHHCGLGWLVVHPSFV